MKEYFSWWESSHSKGERRNFSAVLEKKCVQRRAGRHAGVEEDLVVSRTERDRHVQPFFLQGRMLASFTKATVIKARTRAHHPPIDGGDDDLEDPVALSCQVWFDTEASVAFECDNLDTSATTAQRLRTTFRSDVQIELPEEVPVNSESLTSVGIQKVERKFAVRSVTELTVAAGQQTDKGREARTSSEC